MKYLYLLLIVFLPDLVLCQTGTIKGRIICAGEPVAFATVTVAGTKLGAATNLKGFYVIKDVSAGKYQICSSAIGYATANQNITIMPGQTVIADFNLTESSSKLNEVVITGVSKATALRRNPVPIAVMAKKEMNENVNSNIIDAIVKGVPGVNALTSGPNISKPFIRGLGYNRVLTLYDGIRQEGQQWGDEHGIEIDQYGIGRAEVVKGPASLTYGSDAIAGVINMIPIVNAGEDGVLNGDFTADHHTNNSLLGSSLGLHYQKNSWQYNFRATARLAHDYQNKTDGLIYNTGFREYNLSGMAKLVKSWGSTAFAATVYNNLQEIPDGSRDSVTRQFTRQVDESNLDNIKNRPVVSQQELRSYQIAPLHQHIQHYRFYNRTQLKLGEGNLDASLAFQQNIRREYNHPTLPEQAGLFVALNTVNYDLKYSFPTAFGIESTVGVNGMYQRNHNKDATDFPIPDYNLFDLGTFLYAKRSMGKIDVSSGIRYDTRLMNWDSFYVGPNPANGFEQQITSPHPAQAAAQLQFPEFKHIYRGFSGSLGLTYNINERLLFKANIARGYRAPNITETGSNGLDPGAHIVYLGNRDFKPEFSLQQDLGFLAYLKNFDLVAEIFHNQVSNYIYQSKLTDQNGDPVVIVPGNTTYQYQQSKARLYGAEFTLNLHPETVKWFAFNNSLSYVTGINLNRQLVQSSGGSAKYLPFIPPLHVRSQVKVTVQKPFGHLSKIYFKTEMDAYSAQNRFYALDDTETATPKYMLFNAGAGATFKRQSGKPLFECYLQVENLLNTAYQSNLSRLKYFEYYAVPANARSGIYNMGRNVSVKVVVPF